jgi:hypothetical protein
VLGSLTTEPIIEAPSGGRSERLHVIRGRIAEIGDGYVLLGFSSAPSRMTEGLADGLRPGQRVTITAVLVNDHFIAQKIEPAGKRGGVTQPRRVAAPP